MTTEILRPNAAGDETNLTIGGTTPAATNWESVDEVVSDDNVTIVTSTPTDNNWRRDLYNIANHSVGSGTINFVKVYAHARWITQAPDQTSLKIAVKSGATADEGGEETITAAFANYSNQWNTNPDTALPWTWPELDNIQVGVNMRRSNSGLVSGSRCTQVWIEVDYGIAGITYEVMVDWDMTDWAAVPDFTQPIDDISADVKTVKWIKGEDREEGNSPASTLELNIVGSLYAKYSPYAGGVLAGKLLPWRVARVRAVHKTVTYNVFFGFISKIKVDPNPDNPQAYIYCTDGLDLLARLMVSQDWEDRATMSDGAAVGKVLDASGWSSARRDIDIDGGEIFQYPIVTSSGGIL